MHLPNRLRDISAGLWRIALITGLLLVLNACAQTTLPEKKTPRPPTSKPPATSRPYQIKGQWYYPIPDARGYQEKGLASWYGKDFHGRPTANGETYDMYGVSAAHKTLPLGTVVRVRNLNNGKELDIRVNDRGPFVQGRIIDLSYGAAQELGCVDQGVAPVTVEALGTVDRTVLLASDRKDVFYQGNFTIQVAAFTDPANAERLKARLDPEYVNVHIRVYQEGFQTYYRVRLGQAASLDQARKYEAYMNTQGFPDAFVVAE